MRLLTYGGLLVIFALAGCASLGLNYEAPKVTVNSLRVLESQGLNQRFRLGMTLSNPNAVRLPIEGMSYSLKINGVELVQGVSNNIPELAAFAQSQVELDTSTDILGALRLLNDLLRNQDRTEVAYSLDAKIKVSGLGQAFTVTREGQLPLLNQR